MSVSEAGRQVEMGKNRAGAGRASVKNVDRRESNLSTSMSSTVSEVALSSQCMRTDSDTRQRHVVVWRRRRFKNASKAMTIAMARPQYQKSADSIPILAGT